MPFCGFSQGAGMFDVTPIENMFLLEYLPTAPEEFLRVYLYARMLCLHPELGSDLSGMAKALHMDEETVYNAFAYWEHQGLVMRMKDNPPTYEILPLRNGQANVISPMDRDYYEYREFNANLQAKFGGDNMLGAKEYSKANDWLNVYGFHQDAALRMVDYIISLHPNKTVATVFKHAQKQALEWADQGIKTLEDVERIINEGKAVNDVVREVLKQFGLRRNPSQAEKDCVKRWMQEWNFSKEQILEACSRTTKARNPSFDYLDKILQTQRSGESGKRDELVQVLKQLGAFNTVPTPEEQKMYAVWFNQGFDPRTIELAAIQCNRAKKHSFDELEWMLGKWAELNLYSFEAAEAYVRDLEQRTVEVRQVLAKCGLDRRPGKKDLAMYESWKENFPPDLIDYAAECAQGMQLPMKYADKLLNLWKDGGVSTVEAAKAQHEAARQSRNTTQPSNTNPALNYEQRTYTNEDYGDDFFINLEKEYGNGGGKA